LLAEAFKASVLPGKQASIQLHSTIKVHLLSAFPAATLIQVTATIPAWGGCRSLTQF